MWRLNLEKTPTPTTSSAPLRSCGPLFQEFSIHLPTIPPLNLFVVSLQSLPPVLVSDTYDFLKPTLYVFPPSPHGYVPKFARSSFLPLFHPNPLLLRCYINLTPVPTPLSFARSYAIFCYAWRMHLTCGHSGSDGHISPGGSLVSGEWLASPVHSGACAC